jgi:hypothetical protein
MKREPTGSTWVVLLATGLVVGGVALDFGFTQPQRRAVEQLRRQRADLLGRTAEINSRDAEQKRWAAYLGAASLDAALGERRGQDPIRILGDAMDSSGLRRLELGSQATGETERLRRSRLFLRALGSYPQITQFVASLERDSRLITVDALTIQPATDSNGLELRMNLSIYEPRG